MDNTKKKKRQQRFRLSRKQVLLISLVIVIIIVGLMLIFNSISGYIFKDIYTCVEPICSNGLGTLVRFNDLHTPVMVTLPPP